MARKYDLKSFLIGKLRSISRKWPPLYEAKNRQKREVEVDLESKEIIYKKKRMPLSEEDIKRYKISRSGKRVMYICEKCQGWFFDKYWQKASTGRWMKKSQLALDHVAPIVPVTGWDSWDGYIDRMFNGEVQLLCVDCHHEKSKGEAGERAEHRRKESDKGVKKNNRRRRST